VIEKLWGSSHSILHHVKISLLSSTRLDALDYAAFFLSRSLLFVPINLYSIMNEYSATRYDALQYLLIAHLRAMVVSCIKKGF